MEEQKSNESSKVGTFINSAITKIINLVMILVVIALASLAIWFWNENELLQNDIKNLNEKVEDFEKISSVEESKIKEVEPINIINNNPGIKDVVIDAVDCAKEGEKFSHVFHDEYLSKCCSGLTEWGSGMDTRIVKNGKCIETGREAGSPIGTCINCGDGKCSEIENICNCSEDCDK